MELGDIQALVLSADPQAQHYASSTGGSTFTVWAETSRLNLAADDQLASGWRFSIDRYTAQEFDEVAEAIEAALSAASGVAYQYRVDYEPETGIIHHAFTCEGV